MRLISLLAAGGLAYAAYMLLSDRHADDGPRKRLPAPGGSGTGDGNRVRPSEPAAMRQQPQDEWDAVDEASDESFPASDPPARY
jgi:hypothetical protein